MERNPQHRRRVFVWLTSTLLTASVFAPAAAWAEMIVKPGTEPKQQPGEPNDVLARHRRPGSRWTERLAGQRCEAPT